MMVVIAGDGPEKLKISFCVWHSIGHSLRRKSFRRSPRLLRITDDGAVCCFVRQRKRSQVRCWNDEVTWEQEGVFFFCARGD